MNNDFSQVKKYFLTGILSVAFFSLTTPCMASTQMQKELPVKLKKKIQPKQKKAVEKVRKNLKTSKRSLSQKQERILKNVMYGCCIVMLVAFLGCTITDHYLNWLARKQWLENVGGSYISEVSQEIDDILTQAQNITIKQANMTHFTSDELLQVIDEKITTVKNTIENRLLPIRGFGWLNLIDSNTTASEKKIILALIKKRDWAVKKLQAQKEQFIENKNMLFENCQKENNQAAFPKELQDLCATYL